MKWEDRIVASPDVLVGKPVVKGTRLSVEFIVDLLAEGWTQEQILDNYPNLTAADIRACLAYASELLHFEKVFPLEHA
jgi:uncharacterized protein (DUF433 family)